MQKIISVLSIIVFLINTIYAEPQLELHESLSIKGIGYCTSEYQGIALNNNTNNNSSIILLYNLTALGENK